MCAKILSVTVLLVKALCVAGQIKSALDDLEDEQHVEEQHVCAKDSDKDETMAGFRNASPEAAAEVESYLGLLLNDDDVIKRFEINFLYPEWTSMYVNVAEVILFSTWFGRDS
ncbi:unnamed protein product [Cylicostephanus goldi]|uniref:Uncharacterized protein n=1 Tax=Cylicostephanus goldi TaxID=71465 RepID=A0A3P6RE90_CYLGO|nr:unnamed protein product [Cylicostephanus goldi]